MRKILYKAKYPNHLIPSSDELLKLSFLEKSSLIKDFPVLVARHFHHRLHWFLTNALKRKNGLLGFIIDYSGVLECQWRGSLRRHFVATVEDSPVIDSDPNEKVVDFVDKYVSCQRTLPPIPGLDLTDEEKRLPQYRQNHRHKNVCFQGNRKQCRFGFDFTLCRKQ